MKKISLKCKKVLGGGGEIRIKDKWFEKTSKNQLNQNTKIMKRFILTTVASASVLASAFAQSVTINQTVTPTVATSNTTFTFSRFDSNLGTLSAVQLLLNSATTDANNFTLTLASSGELVSITGRIRTQGTGLSLTAGPAGALNTNPGVGHVWGPGSETFSLIAGQPINFAASPYSITSGSWSDYQNAGGTGNVPNFTATFALSSSVDTSGSTIPDWSALTASTNYTLRYTYTPGTAPVPEPGQVAASLLLLSGIGAYVFIKRRKKSAPAAA